MGDRQRTGGSALPRPHRPPGLLRRQRTDALRRRDPGSPVVQLLQCLGRFPQLGGAGEGLRVPPLAITEMITVTRQNPGNYLPRNKLLIFIRLH